MTPATGLVFSNAINLASEALGARAIEATDEFFAPKENLVKDAAPIYLPDEYTEQGKWMDGWESRRKRGNGHDWCIIRLGERGIVRGLDIDTSHFLGNQPPFASVDCSTDLETWSPLLPQVPIRPGSSNLFIATAPQEATHLRLNLFPDGGVARLRAFGEVIPAWAPESDASVPTKDGEVDLAALKNGGRALVCSDSFFSSMNHLLLPAVGRNMGDGWETRRRQGRPYDDRPDWIVVALGAAGEVGLVEIDTRHFRGNFPDRASLEGVHAPGLALTDLLETEWTPILDCTPLKAHARHFYRDEILAAGPFTHVRLRIYPDGGVSRLRIYGTRS
ncbi:MAG: allantoicase [Myxococcota bacterium]